MRKFKSFKLSEFKKWLRTENTQGFISSCYHNYRIDHDYDVGGYKSFKRYALEMYIYG